MKFFRHVSLHMTRSAAPSQQQRGQSAVEIALILPVLLILLTGIIMVGFIMYAYNQVSNAAREGARAGSLYRTTQAQSGWTNVLQPVQNVIYDPSTGESALGSLPINASSFVVTSSDVVCQIRKEAESYATAYNCAGVTAPQAGDRLYVQVTYRYTQPILSAFLPVFPQPIVIVKNVMMEIQ